MRAKAKPLAKLSIEVDNPKLLRALASEAEERGRSVQEILEEALDGWLRKRELYELNKAGGSLMDLPLAERVWLLSGTPKPLTEKERVARQEQGRKLDELRERIGPIDIPVEDLLHMEDDELIAKYGYGTK